MTEIRNRNFDEERALYASENIFCENCTFAGPADGESAFKESQNLTVSHCRFALRYPFWHDHTVSVTESTLEETCRAAFWYTEDAVLTDCILHGIKAFRECRNSTLTRCDIISSEFGWNCRSIAFRNVTASGEYFLLGTSDVQAEGLELTGKYSFQYVKNAELHNCTLRTKDAFWHAENVTVYDSEISGEYLGWYSKNLRLVRCRLSGTQPLCYAENLILEDCTMDGCDLSFENTSVKATVRGHIDSVKNPTTGFITCGSIGTLILDEHRKPDSDCVITQTEK